MAYDFAHTERFGWVMVKANEEAGMCGSNFPKTAPTMDDMEQMLREIETEG